MQCDQIGRFLKDLYNIFIAKIAQIFVKDHHFVTKN